ncbi:MAG: hypothetical protein HUJ25_17720 [Crocinitomicaceae bacterium]|nr:hypothetical protein [Crocinitomicaceae bacterium]
MGPAEAFILLVVIGAVVSWIIAGVRGYQLGSSKGLTLFFFHLIGALASVFLLWLLLVYPEQTCNGNLCLLEYLVYWFISSMIIMLVWPLILIAVFKRKWSKKVKIPKRNDEILDGDL